MVDPITTLGLAKTTTELGQLFEGDRFEMLVAIGEQHRHHLVRRSRVLGDVSKELHIAS